MRSGAVMVLLSLVCLVSGALLWTTGQREQRVLGAERALLTLNYDTPATGLEEQERSTSPFGRIPWIGSAPQTMAEQRAQAAYWRGDYGALPTTEELEGASSVAKLLAANAAFRRLKLDGSDARAVDKLLEVSAQYAELVKARPGLVEAAFNYEFVARTREALSRPRSARAPRLAAPPAQTLHGHPGAAPTATDMGDFKVIIPHNPQERQQRPESGAGGAKVRKG
jgi:hypothetical protein